MSASRPARRGLALCAAITGACSGSGEPDAPADRGATHRLLDRIDEWTIDSPWGAIAPVESGLEPILALEFEEGWPAGLFDARLVRPLPGTPPLRAGAAPATAAPPAVASGAAHAGRAGLRFERAAGAVAQSFAVHPDTAHVFSARVRRGVDPIDYVAATAPEERDAQALALARDAAVGSVVILEMHAPPPPGIDLAALVESLAARENVVVASHVLAPRGARGEWEELRLEWKCSIFTRALVIGLLGGNPGWWRLEASAWERDEAPDGAVDFDAVRLFELPVSRWLSMRQSTERDDLPWDPPPAAASPRSRRNHEFRRRVKMLGEVREALLAPPGTVASLELELPRGPFRLQLAYGVLEERRAGSGEGEIRFRIELEREGEGARVLLDRAHRAASSPAALAWQEWSFEAQGRGERATLRLATEGDAAREEMAAFGSIRLDELRPDGMLPRNLLLISIDTLRADRLGCYGYARADGEATTPRLDELAREAIRFASARSVAPYTLPSHATLLTGMSPRVHRVTRHGRRLVPGTHPLLAEELAAQGYATGAFTGGAFVSYEHGFHHGFDRYSILDPFLTAEDPYREAFPRPGERAFNDAAYAVHDRAAIERWIGAQRGRPFFLFVHTYVAHNYRAGAEFERRFVRPEDADALGEGRDLKRLDLDAALGGGAVAPRVARAASDFYDAAVAAADAQVGELLDHLRESGMLERTVVAIVSDHGEELGEHGGLLHGRTLYEEALRVPWLLRIPGAAARVIEEPVDLADVAPTLRAAAGLPPEPGADGCDVLQRIEESQFADLFWAEVSAPGLARRSALLAHGLKLIETPSRSFEEPQYESRAAPPWELYLLAADASERRNAVSFGAGAAGAIGELLPDEDQPKDFLRMRRMKESVRMELTARRDVFVRDPDALGWAASGDSLRLLRALGYATAEESGDDD